MIYKRDDAIQAAAVGIGILAQGLVRLSDATRRAAAALEELATTLAEQNEESSSNGGSGATGPTGDYWSPYDSWSSSGPPPASP